MPPKKPDTDDIFEIIKQKQGGVPVRVGLYMPKGVYEDAKKLCDKHDTSVSAFVVELILREIGRRK